MIAILALSLIMLQQRFDKGDYDRAILMLADKRPGDRWSVNQELNERAGSSPYACAPLLISSFRGTLEVTCPLGKAGTYRFAVDLVRKVVEPLDDATRELMQTVQSKNLRSSADGG